MLRKFMELKAIPLGEKIGGGGLPMQSKPREVYYPSVQFTTEQPVAFAKKGKATVEYELRSTTAEERDGQPKKYRYCLDLTSIDPGAEPKKDAKPKEGDGAKPVEMHAEVSAVRDVLLEMIGRERDRMGRFIPPAVNEGGAEAMREAYPARQKRRKVAPTAIGAAGLVGGALALRAGLKGMRGGPMRRAGLGLRKPVP